MAESRRPASTGERTASAGSPAGRSRGRPSALTRPAAEPAQAFFLTLGLSQPADLQRRSGRDLEFGERTIVGASTYIFKSSTGLNIFEDPSGPVLKLWHLVSLVNLKI
jgi:hypothetical protein